MWLATKITEFMNRDAFILLLLILTATRSTCFISPISTSSPYGWNSLAKDSSGSGGGSNGRSNLPLISNQYTQNYFITHTRNILYASKSTSTLSLSNSKKSPLKQPKSNRVAIRWVVESVEKVLQEEHEEQQRKRKLNLEDTPAYANTTEDENLLLDTLHRFHQGKCIFIETLLRNRI